jgi:hypothetical protein
VTGAEAQPRQRSIRSRDRPDVFPSLSHHRASTHAAVATS